MRVAIIEDNEIDRLNLMALLGNEADVEIVGAADNLDEAEVLVDGKKPCAIFLDIHLGRQRGFTLLQRIKHRPKVVITTSHPHYAVRGFEIDAVDYLMKPIDAGVLSRSVSRLRGYVETEPAGASERLDTDSMVVLRQSKDMHFVQVGRIQAITAERVYTRVLVSDGRDLLHSRPMREWRDILPGQFRGLDRSTIVNMSEILKVKRGVKPGTGVLILRGGERKIELGRVAMLALTEAVS